MWSDSRYEIARPKTQVQVRDASPSAEEAYCDVRSVMKQKVGELTRHNAPR